MNEEVSTREQELQPINNPLVGIDNALSSVESRLASESFTLKQQAHYSQMLHWGREFIRDQERIFRKRATDMLNFWKGASPELQTDRMREEIVKRSGVGLYLMPLAEGSPQFLETFVCELGLKNLDDIKGIDTDLPKAKGVLASVSDAELGEEFLKQRTTYFRDSDLLFYRPRKLPGEQVSNLWITISDFSIQELFKSQSLPPLPPSQATQS